MAKTALSFVVQSKIASIVFALANLLGIFFYFSAVLAIAHEIRREERDPDFGDSLNFITTCLPIIGMCLLLDLAWVVKALFDVFRHRGYLALITSGLVFAIWVASLLLFRA